MMLVGTSSSMSIVCVRVRPRALLAAVLDSFVALLLFTAALEGLAGWPWKNYAEWSRET